jgi:integrase
MKINNPRKLQKDMLRALKTSYYNNRSIKRFNQMLKKICISIENGECSTYEELFSKKYQGKTNSVERNGRWLLGAIEQFDKTKELPNGRTRSSLGRTLKLEVLSKEFQNALAHYQQSAKNRELKASTINVVLHAGICLFTTLQQSGIFGFKQITEDSIVNYFVGLDGKPCKSGSYRKSLISLFRGLGGYISDLSICRLIGFLPEISCKRKNIQYLSKDEFKNLHMTLTDRESSLSKRNCAIGLIAMYTGLRSCDIIELRLDAIDWDNDIISIIQQKTEQPLTLPLTAIVGNAIYDYIQNERPNSTIPEIFLTSRLPYRRMVNGDATNIASLIMRVAGVRTNKGDRKGFHIFRHFAATKMLSQDVSLPVISAILGHSSPQSTQTYLSADFIHLERCALSIADFPVKKEVLS